MIGPFDCAMFMPVDSVSLDCTGTSARAALPNVKADTLCISNPGSECVFVALGDGDVEATTASAEIPPGTFFFTVPPTGCPTHIAGITAGNCIALRASVGSAV